MPTIQQALTTPTPGADLTRVQVFIATKLSASDYATAVNLLNSALQSTAVAPL